MRDVGPCECPESAAGHPQIKSHDDKNKSRNILYYIIIIIMKSDKHNDIINKQVILMKMIKQINKTTRTQH